jgi:hypothetical protein
VGGVPARTGVETIFFTLSERFRVSPACMGCEGWGLGRLQEDCGREEENTSCGETPADAGASLTGAGAVAPSWVAAPDSLMVGSLGLDRACTAIASPLGS